MLYLHKSPFLKSQNSQFLLLSKSQIFDCETLGTIFVALSCPAQQLDATTHERPVLSITHLVNNPFSPAHPRLTMTLNLVILAPLFAAMVRRLLLCWTRSYCCCPSAHHLGPCGLHCFPNACCTASRMRTLNLHNGLRRGCETGRWRRLVFL